MEKNKVLCITVLGILTGVFLLVSCKSTYVKMSDYEGFKAMMTHALRTPEDVIQRFPKTVDQVKNYSAWVMQLVQNELKVILAQTDDQRTFDNTVRAYDTTHTHLFEYMGILEMLHMLSADDAVRVAAQTEHVNLQKFSVDLFMVPEVYRAFDGYVKGNKKKENLTQQEEYFLRDLMQTLKRDGLHLPDQELARVKDLQKEIAQWSMKFTENIAIDKSTITVSREELAGISSDLLASLQQDATGNYLVTCDYPTYFEVMGHCTVPETRKALYYAFSNRAYPANKEILDRILALRDQLAKSLGFSNFAQCSLDGEMAGTPEKVEEFLNGLVAKAKLKLLKECALLKKNLPQGISLSKDGKFNGWDLEFVRECYRKRYLDLDQHKIAEYFPLEKTLQGMLDIYQEFLGLTFKHMSLPWAWHSEVQLIAVYDATDKSLLGYLFLDLYPRPNKYSHACLIPGIPGCQTKDKRVTPGMATLVANFPQATETRPALLRHEDVKTFFHEFGHAMHHLLGRTELASHAGTSVKLDFVEMPSQMLEEWMFDRDILKKLSSHYDTGESLPDSMSDALVDLKQFDSGAFLVRQCYFSFLSLKIHQQAAIDIDALSRDLYKDNMLHVAYTEGTHQQASFGHLTGYGARYYGYMWSKVFALDAFAYINKIGLLNPAAGRRLVSEILGKGGSNDPWVLLKNFLGRDVTADAFYQNLGI